MRRATIGAAMSCCATSKAARHGRRPTSRAARGPTATTSCSPRIARSSCGATAPSPRPSTSSSRRRTTPRSDAFPSSTRAVDRAISSSPPMPRSCWRRRSPIRRIRPSPSSSWRPSTWPAPAPSWRRAVGAARANPSCGPPIWRSSRARRSARSRSRPIAPASSAAATTSAMQSPRSTDGACPTPSEPCSIRFSRCAGACGFPRAARRGSPSGRWWPRRARRCSTRSTSTRTPMPSSGPPRWPGPRHKCSCATST